MHVYHDDEMPKMANKQRSKQTNKTGVTEGSETKPESLKRTSRGWFVCFGFSLVVLELAL